MQKVASYTIECALGSGAQGEVFRAIHENGQVVALKLLREEFANDDEVAGRFRRESQVAQSIRHPNVVSALDAGVENGRPWLAYAFIDGGDLEALIRRSVRLTQFQSLSFLKEIISGLSALQNNGLVHRDIKPANILITKEGRAAITDHGLARPTNDARTQYTQTGALVGSPAYMAPEQIEGTVELDIRADLYAAGVVFYEMLSGVLPFNGNHIIEILNKHLEADVPNICDLVPGVHEECAKLIGQLLEKDVHKRIAKPSDVIQRIDQIIVMIKNASDLETLADANQTLDVDFSNRFPATIEAGSDVFPATLDQDQSFPATIDEAGTDFPLTIDEQSNVTNAAVSASGARNDGLQVSGKHNGKEPDFHLQPSEESKSQGANRIRLSLTRASQTSELFIYAGNCMRMGRTGLDRTDAEVCLRLRPAQGNESLIRKISGLHLSMGMEDNQPYVQDNNSSAGTTWNGKPMIAGSRQPCTERVNLQVAGVLDLSVQPIFSTHTRYVVEDVGAALSCGGIYVQRPNNGTEHSYLLVNGACAFDEHWRPHANGNVVIMNINDGLWIHCKSIADGHAVALVPGVHFELNAFQLHVSEIQASDQK